MSFICSMCGKSAEDHCCPSQVTNQIAEIQRLGVQEGSLRETIAALCQRIRTLEAGIEAVAQYCDQQSDYADENMEGPSGIWFGKCAARLRALLGK